VTSRLLLLYPFLFVVIPVLNILTQSPGGSDLGDSALIMAVLLAGCGALYGLVVVATGGRWSNPVVPLIVFLAVLSFYGWDLLPESVHQMGRRAPVLLVAGFGVVVLLATVLGVWWLARHPRPLTRMATFLTITGAMLVAVSCIRIVAAEIRARRVLRDSALARELARPVGNRPAASTPQSARPDIYLIVLDEYANSGVLKEVFGFDNRAFEDSLRHLGFTVPRLVRSNYVHTLLSIPSLLNFSHLTRLTKELGPRETDPTLPDYLVENNRTAAFLRERGYEFLFFPSQWWISTARNRNADWEFHPWTGINLAREATRSDLRRFLVRSTLLDFVARGNNAWDADHVRRTLAELEHVPERQAPTFVFAHLLNPHGPYVFTADCQNSAGKPAGKPSSQKEHPYVAQIQCLDRMLLHLVTTLLRQSPEPPVILLQGDHGSNLLRYSSAKSAGAVSPAQARERFGAFGAYYLPNGGGRLFADTVTVVNVVRNVLNHYFDAGIPLAPDELYMSLEHTPYNFVRVDPATLRPAESAGR
jgi:sulfatase-like protein